MIKFDLAGVQPLPLRVRQKPHETAHSLLCRLAAINGSKSVKHLLQRVPNLGVSISELSQKREIALPTVLSLSSYTNLFTPNLYCRGGNGRLGKFKGVASVEKFKICPLCLAKDTKNKPASDHAIHAYIRDFWHFRAIEFCPKHGVEMQVNCLECGSEFSRKTLFGCHCACGADVRQIPCKTTYSAKMPASWAILRQINQLPDVPYWRLGRSQYPSHIDWGHDDINHSEYSKRQLMVMGPQLLKPRVKTTAWYADANDFFRYSAAMLERSLIKTREQRIASRFLP